MILFFQRKLSKNSRGNRISLFCAFLLNTVITSFFIMTVTGLDNITNDKLTPNDMQQIMAVISSISLTGIITILFLQWIVWSLYNALYESRAMFNKTIRMIGVSNKKLLMIYILEYLYLQILVLPFSTILSNLFYNTIMPKYGFESSIDIFSVILATFITVLISLFALLYSYKKNINYLSYKNSVNKNHYAKKVKKSGAHKYVKRFIGVVLFILLIVSLRISILSSFNFILSILIITIFWNDIITIFCFLIRKIVPPQYHIICNLLRGNLKSIKIISYTIIFGITLVFGIDSLISTSRQIGYDRVIANIKYDAAIQSDKYLEEGNFEFKTDNTNTALLFLENRVGSSELGVLAIDQNYLKEYESLNFNFENKLAIYDDINKSTYNGIILPNHLIDEKDIGNTITLSINDTLVDFVVTGGYDVNDYSTMFAYVSKEYVRSQAHLPDLTNVIFIKGNYDIEKYVDDTFTVRTKNDIAYDSYNKIVQSTFVLEITAMIVLLTSFFMLANFIFLSSGKNKIDIARMRCMGMSKHNINFIYIGTYVFIVLLSMLISTIPAFMLGNGLLYSMLNIRFDLLFNWKFYGIILCIYILFILLCYLLVSKKTISKYINLIRIKTSGDNY